MIPIYPWRPPARSARRAATIPSAWNVFGYSIIYLFVLFLGVIADALWRIPLHI
jgi:heme O synthase-like polyprenyltransferase